MKGASLYATPEPRKMRLNERCRHVRRQRTISGFECTIISSAADGNGTMFRAFALSQYIMTKMTVDRILTRLCSILNFGGVDLRSCGNYFFFVEHDISWSC